MNEKKKTISPKFICIVIAVSALMCTAAAAGIVLFTQLSPVTVCGEKYPRNITQIDLSGRNLSGETEKLLQLTALRSADLTDTGLTPVQYDRIHTSMPECKIKWSVPLGDGYYANDITELKLEKSISPSELNRVKYFYGLETLDAEGYPLCDELYDVVVAAKDAGINCLLKDALYGCEVTNRTESLDLSGSGIDSLDEFYNKLRFFPNISQIYAGDVPLPDEDMDQLNKAFPDTKIVWLVEFARWQVRTDIKVFSTLIGAAQRKTFDQNELHALLAYCTELRALDIGHNHLTDISLLENLQNLQILIISGNKPDNIEAIGHLSELFFLEMFDCDTVNDIAPLKNCSHLEYLMLNNTGDVNNVSVLENCHKLKLLYVRLCNPVGYSWDDLQKALPNCTINRKTYVTKGVWRNSELNDAIRKAFNNWNRVETFNSWNDFTINNQATFGWKIN